MADQLSYTQLVAQALSTASAPLTLDEIWTHVARVRPVKTKNPRSTLRNALNSLPLAATLGGRPARYTWWPNHLTGSVFRQLLSAADVSSGGLVLGIESWLALWPDFFVGALRSACAVTLELAGGPVLETSVEPLEESGWGLKPIPALATWYQRVGAAPGDDLIVRVIDVAARRYAVSLVRQTERDPAAIAARNRTLADVAERLVRQGADDMPDFYLIPRLIASDVYQQALPPEPWDKVLRADLRFVVHEGRSVWLVDRLVDVLERETPPSPDPFDVSRPRGQWRKARGEEERQAWAEYFFNRGMDYRRAGYAMADEAYYRAAVRLDPGHADAWVHIGNRRFGEGLVLEALADYRRGQAAAEARTIGDPATYSRPFWGDLDSRPFMRALHGQGLCLWRLGQTEKARDIFAWMLTLNPNDNQGVRFLLYDLDEGLSWEESIAHEEQEQQDH
ncbi:MAG: hypothetical protein ACP5J4_13705 [Anaerolineae bacterium]